MSDAWPDVEGGFKTYLRGDAGVVAALGAARVFFDMPHEPTFPLIVVRRVGGGDHPTSDAPTDEAIVAIDLWGELNTFGQPLWAELGAVVNSVRSALSGIRGRTALAPGVDVSDPVVSGLVRLPDPSNGRPRYTMTVATTAIATPQP